MSELYKIHSFYKFSLDSFVIVVKRAIDLVQERDRKAKEAAKKAAAGDDGEGEEEGDGDGDGDGEEKKEEEEAPEEEQQLEMSPKSLEKRVADLTESITF
jgi:dynein heavy chain